MKAVIMESHENFAYALRDDGEFVRVNGKGLTIGSVVNVKKNNRSTWRKIAACAAAFVFLVAGGGTYNYFAMENYSVVSLDINPSIEYSLNRFDRVVSVKAVNLDGEAIVEDISGSVVHHDIKYALSTTVDSLRSNNYIKDDAESVVVVSVYSKGEQNQEALNTAVEEFSAESAEVCSVRSVSVTKEEKEIAENLGITAGKLTLVSEAVAVMGTDTGDTDTARELAELTVEELTAISTGEVDIAKDNMPPDSSELALMIDEQLEEKTEVVDNDEQAAAVPEESLNEDVDEIPVDSDAEESSAKGNSEAGSSEKTGEEFVYEEPSYEEASDDGNTSAAREETVYGADDTVESAAPASAAENNDNNVGTGTPVSGNRIDMPETTVAAPSQTVQGSGLESIVPADTEETQDDAAVLKEEADDAEDGAVSDSKEAVSRKKPAEEVKKKESESSVKPSKTVEDDDSSSEE